MNSCIYVGQVRHRRFLPLSHQFSYRLFMLYLDLDELPMLFDRFLFWSYNRRNIASFMRKDYFSAAKINLPEAIREYVFNQTGSKPDGPVRLLTHLRYFGYSFNPVSFYYCFEKDGLTIHSVVAEITNTPWNERRAYVLRPETVGKMMYFRFSKDFHVSPFNPLDQDYDWRLSCPDDLLTVHMNVAENGNKIFDATMRLNRRSITSYNLNSNLIFYPLMTIRVVSAIYWQALRLWLKKVRIFDHPSKSSNKEAPDSVKNYE